MGYRLKTIILGTFFWLPTGFAETVKLESRVTKDSKTSFYDQLFSISDSTLYNAYMDRWTYHEKDLSYSLTRASYEHRDPSVLGGAPLESDIRRDFANAILRERIDTFGRFLLEPLKNLRALKPFFAAAALYYIATHPKFSLQLEKSSETPTVVNVGYDLPHDSALIEVSRGRIRTGLYQDGVFQSVANRKPLASANVRVGADLEDRVTTVSLGYGIVSGSLSSALARRLSRTVTGELNSTIETKVPSQWSAAVRVSYAF